MTHDMEWFDGLEPHQRRAVTSWVTRNGLEDAVSLTVRGHRVLGARVGWRDNCGRVRVHPDGERIVTVVRPLDLTAPVFL